MKKTGVLIIVFALISIFSFTASAEVPEDLMQSNEVIDEYICSVIDALDDESKYILSQFHFDENFSKAFLDISFKDIVHCLKDAFGEEIKVTVSSFSKTLALLLVLIIVKSLRNDEDNLILNDVFSCCVIIIVSFMISDIIRLLASSFKVIANLLYSLIPILTVILSLSGNVTFSAVFSTMMIGLSQLLAFLSDNIIIPLTGIYFALIISMNFNDSVNVLKFTHSVNKFAVTVLSIVSTIFMLLLSSKNTLATDVDGIIFRSGKHLVSNLIPIVGSSVSMVLDSVVGSLGLIKGTVGIFAVIAVLCVNIPVFIRTIVCRISLCFTSILVDSLGDSRTASLIGSVSATVRFLCVLAFFELITVVISTGLAVSVKGITL